MSIRITFLKNWYQNGLLLVLIFIGIAPGLWQEIFTPTLPNLKEKLNVSYEVMGRMMSLRSMGNIAALIVTGYVYDSFPAYVGSMISVACFIGGLCTLIIPWCKQFWLVVVLFFIQSGFQNSMNNGAQLIILKTFKEKAVGKMQIYHLGYGIGGLLSGLISQPFLSKSVSRNAKITKYCRKVLNETELGQIVPSIIGSNISSIQIENRRLSFEYIYVIAGVVAILIAIVNFAYSFLPNPDAEKYQIKKREPWIKSIHPKYTANGKICFGTTMTILLYLYYFFYIFGLLNFLPYIVVYAIDPCKKYYMTQKTSAYLHSAVNACFLIGRIFGSIFSQFNPTAMILTFNSFNVLFVFVLLFFSNDYAIALWIGACGMRFCNSVVYPTGTSYINRFIIVSSTLISIAFLGGTTGVIFGQYTGGFIIDNYPSYCILYTCFGSMCMLLGVTVLIIILGSQTGLRAFSEDLKNEKQEEFNMSAK